MIDTWEEFSKLKAHVAESSYEHVFLDLETDSAQERKAKIFGIGIAFNGDEAYYIPMRLPDRSIPWSTDQFIHIEQWIAMLCRTKKLVGHNLLYDCLVWEYNTGVDISKYIYSDTILLKHLIQEERPFGLKEIAVEYLGPDAEIGRAHV